MLDDFNSDVKRKVWENSNSTNLLTVNTLLKTGRYAINKTEKDDGVIVLEFKPID